MRPAVILMGPPGAGKGTQARKLGLSLACPKISTGDILREAVQEGTELGVEARRYVESGRLVPDGLVDAIVQERLGRDDCREGFILDGYPRTLAQARFLGGVLAGRDLDVQAIGIRVPDEALVQRLAGRWSCPKCGKVFNEVGNPSSRGDQCDECRSPLMHRKDDSEDVVAERIAIYHRSTEPLIGYYREQGCYREVDGEGTVEGIFETLKGMILDQE